MNEKKDFFRTLGEKVIIYRIPILIFWIVLTLFAGLGALNVHKILQGEGSYVKGSESYEQSELITKHFPQQYTKNIIVTLKSKKLTMDSPEYIQAIEKIETFAKSKKEVGAVFDYKLEPDFASKDKKSTFILLGLTDDSAEISSEDADIITRNIKKIIIDPDIEMHITGSAVIVGDITRISGNDSARAEKRILPIVIVLLIFVFGAIVSALLPIVLGFMSIIITLGCLFLIGHYFELTMFCKAITSMMGLGVGIDYSLFMVSRFREELIKGKTPKQAAIDTTATAGKAVCYSGFAVTVGMAALLIPNLPLTHSIGFSGILVVTIAILLSLTLLPVIFSLVGERINSPRAFHRLVKLSSSPQNFWLNWSKMVMKRPVTFFVLGLVTLLMISSFTLSMKLWNSSVLLMPEWLDSRKGFVHVLEIDPSRKFSPVGVSFETKDGSSIYDRKNIKEIYEFSEKVLGNENIKKVLGIVDPSTKTSLEAYQNFYTNALMMQNLQMTPQNPFVNQEGTKTIMWAIHRNSENETEDWNTVISLRKIRDSFVSNNLKILIGGGGSTNVDFQNAVYKHFPLIILLIVIATYIIMFSLLGSIILPFKAIFMNIISVTSSYGWLILVFKYGVTANILGITQLPGGLLIITPLVLFCIIFGLSMDYEIFMMSRIKEEYDKSNDIDYAVSMGLEKSGGIITSAALIMIIVFSAFSFSNVIMVQEIGLGLSAAVFIDATIIRIMLVPSILKILDKSAWWLPKAWRDKFILVKLEH